MKSKPLYFTLSLRIFRETKCFGKGVAQLLELVDELHSLRQATQEMNIAYSKAWTVIKVAERELGFKLLETTTGGRHGGGAILTPEARRLLADYHALCDEVQAAAEASFAKHFAAYE